MLRCSIIKLIGIYQYAILLCFIKNSTQDKVERNNVCIKWKTGA